MSKLSDFGARSTDDIPPLIFRKNAVESPTSPGKPAGFVGYDRRREHRVYITRRKEYHYYKSGYGYAISDYIINRVGRADISRIVIHAVEDGNVYEFGYHAYRDDAEPVPDSLLLDQNDPQSYVPVGDCLSSWKGLGEDVYVDPFETVMERISGRGWW